MLDESEHVVADDRNKLGDGTLGCAETEGQAGVGVASCQEPQSHSQLESNWERLPQPGVLLLDRWCDPLNHLLEECWRNAYESLEAFVVLPV